MVSLTRLQPQEWQRLRSIRLRALIDAPDAFGTTFEEANAWSPDDWCRQLMTLPTVVAVKDGVDVGMARYAPDETRQGTGWLISLWVDPSARRMGAGSALTDAVVDLARAAGAIRLLLDVADGNAAAVALYEARGFVSNGQTGSLPPPRAHIREHQRERRI
jgi:ribosomal protein S18 acetylase RimI-like enzyme